MEEEEVEEVDVEEVEVDEEEEKEEKEEDLDDPVPELEPLCGLVGHVPQADGFPAGHRGLVVAPLQPLLDHVREQHLGRRRGGRRRGRRRRRWRRKGRGRRR